MNLTPKSLIVGCVIALLLSSTTSAQMVTGVATALQYKPFLHGQFVGPYDLSQLINPPPSETWAEIAHVAMLPPPMTVWR